MRTTPEQRALVRSIVEGGEAGQIIERHELLDDLDEALSELAALRAVAEAARDAAECDGHAECCNTTLLAEQRGKAKGLPDSDVWDETECDCAAGRTRVALRAALRAWEER